MSWGKEERQNKVRAGWKPPQVPSPPRPDDRPQGPRPCFPRCPGESKRGLVFLGYGAQAAQTHTDLLPGIAERAPGDCDGCTGRDQGSKTRNQQKKNFLTTAAQKLPNGAVGTEIRKISIKRCGHHVATVGAPEIAAARKNSFPLQQLLLLLLLLLCFEILRTL